jgi:predicted amidohydrolase
VSREVTIAAVQLPASPVGNDYAQIRESNFRAAEYWLNLAGERGADIGCVGETINILGASLTPDNFRAALDGVYEEALERLGAIARRHQMVVIAPVAALIESVPRNVALILNRQGALEGCYAKVHCTENERRLGIVPGDDWPVFSLDFGKIGVQICHDASFPESARCLALNGAEIVFWPHTMSGWGDDFMDILLRGPAVYNGITHVPVCFGVDPGKAWRPGMLIGHSSIIAPDGVVTADAGRQVGMALATVDLDQLRIAHDFTRSGEHIWRNDMRADRRPETYGPLTRAEQTTFISNDHSQENS